MVKIYVHISPVFSCWVTNGKLHSCIKVHVNSFINYVINMITMDLLFMKYVAMYNLHKLWLCIYVALYDDCNE